MDQPGTDGGSGPLDRGGGGFVLTDTVYGHLRAIAQNKLKGEQVGHTLQATALVNEAFLRMKGVEISGDPGPAFYFAAAEAMRRVLIDHARTKKAAKRGGGARKVDIVDVVSSVADLAQAEEPEAFEALDEAILRLEKEDPRCADLVRLRFYAGLSAEEAARAIGISLRTAHREWEFARAWLARELGGGGEGKERKD